MRELDLSGAWRVIDSESSASDFHGIDFDDSAWPEIKVPSHWTSHSVLADGVRTVFYRHRFEVVHEETRRSWIQFDGVFTHASVWVDGSYVGDIDGYFARHSFEITDALADSPEHVVAVEVSAPHFAIPWTSPGGIWQPVSVINTGCVRIARSRILCSEADEERGVLTCHLELDASEPCDVRIRSLLTPEQESHLGTDHEITRKLAAGANRLSWQITMDQPSLWWPWSLGNQAFYELAIEVIDVRAPHQISDTTTSRVGFRQASFEKGTTFINGERLFTESIECGNDGTPPIETDHAYFLDMLSKRRYAGANLLLRSQWIEPRPFYDVADELGMLVWQGVPHAGKAPQARHARQMIEMLGHHPSIALWLRPQKRIRDRRPAPDTIKRTLDKSDSSRANIEQPLGWDLKRLHARDVLAIVPKWTKRSRLLYFTSDQREASGHIDAVRLLKYRPLGGFVAPLALPELIEGACDTVRLIAIPKQELETGEEGEIDVFIVNDRRSPISDAVVEATAADEKWSWTGNVGADSAGFIGTMTVTPTESAIAITLRLNEPECDERNVRIPVKRSGV